MTTPTPATDDHRARLRELLAHAGSYAQALDDIAHDNPRREADVMRQLAAWHARVGALLPKDKPPATPYELAARQFDPPGYQDRTTK